MALAVRQDLLDRLRGASLLPLPQAASAVHDLLTDKDVVAKEEVERRKRLIELAQGGHPESEAALLRLIAEVLEETAIRVDGISGGVEAHARVICDRLFGLDVLGPLYRAPGVDEIRVNRWDRIYYQEHGRNTVAEGLRFHAPEDLENLIRRLILHTGKAIDQSNPVVESQRLDGTRITATLPPFSHHPTLVLRRHGTFTLTPETVVASGMVNEALLRLLAALVRGRANLLISGATGSGKTSLLRFLVRYLHPKLRIVTLETHWELGLDEAYPDRDIVALQEVPGRISMQEAFRHILRQTPNVIIVGEARGGEADETVKACVRGHDGTMATGHFTGVREAIRGMARLIVIDGGKPVPLELQEIEVAEAFDVVVQMRGDPEGTGRRIVEQVTEVWVERGEIQFRDLCRWQPGAEDWWQGTWVFPNAPTPRLRAKLARYGVVWDDHEPAGQST